MSRRNWYERNQSYGPGKAKSPVYGEGAIASNPTKGLTLSSQPGAFPVFVNVNVSVNEADLKALRDAFMRPMGLISFADGYAATSPHPMPTEVRTEYVTAHRVWWAVLLGNNVAFLRSWTREALWPFSAPFVASTLDRSYSFNRPHPHGIYAYKQSEDALRHDRFATPPDCGGARVVRVTGTAALWGKVIEHQFGYRAEKAYPLWISSPDEETAGALRRWYGCDTSVVGKAS